MISIDFVWYCIFYSRSDCEFLNKVIKPFDWTFTTDYKGTIVSTGPEMKVSSSVRIQTNWHVKTDAPPFLCVNHELLWWRKVRNNLFKCESSGTLAKVKYDIYISYVGVGGGQFGKGFSEFLSLGFQCFRDKYCSSKVSLQCEEQSTPFQFHNLSPF